MHSIFTLIVTLLLTFNVCAISPSFAKESDVKPTGDLKKIEAQIAEQKKQQDALKAKLKDISKDVDGLKSGLIKTTEDVQKYERSTTDLETKMTDLQAKKADILQNMNQDRTQLAGLLAALERIRRTPPEALIARQDAPLKTAQAAIILKAIIPELHKRAEALRGQIAELDQVETSLQSNKAELTLSAKKLLDEKTKMESMLSMRQKLMTETEGNFETNQKTIAQLSQNAKDMRELIRKIEEKQRKAREEAERKRAERLRKRAELAAKKAEDNKKINKKETPAERQKRLNDDIEDQKEEKREERQLASLPDIGTGRLPLSGTIKVRYGQKDDIGATSEGLRIVGRGGAVVVAPLGGVIRYAGPFKKYGTIILLEHKNNYMSLIAGLGRIDTVEGQRVDAGEPLGKMGDGSNPILYYELRYRGDPINPASKINS